MLVDARERHAEFGSVAKIPRANYGDILGTPETRVENCFNGSNSHRIVVGKYSVWTWGKAEQPLRQFRSALSAVNIYRPSRENVARQGFHLVFCQRLKISIETPNACTRLRPT